MNNIVSVVIPTYKRPGNQLIKSIESVLKQTYKNIEVIVVDDNGENSDYSIDIRNSLREYPDIIYVAHEKNKGACEARNTGILNSKGDYIAFLDDDDTWEQSKIEKQLKKFDNPNVGLVYCGIKYYYEKNDKIVYKPAVRSDNPCKDLLIHNFIGSTSCGIVKKSSAVDVGMFDKNLKSGQDLDFWYRIAKKYDIDFVEECLLNYTIFKANTITANYNNRLLSNLYLKEKYSEIIYGDRELITIYNFKIIKSYIKLKKPIKALFYFLKSWNKREIYFKYLIKYI